jgi:hypothetical protein
MAGVKRRRYEKYRVGFLHRFVSKEIAVKARTSPVHSAIVYKRKVSAACAKEQT